MGGEEVTLPSKLFMRGRIARPCHGGAALPCREGSRQECRGEGPAASREGPKHGCSAREAERGGAGADHKGAG